MSDSFDPQFSSGDDYESEYFGSGSGYDDSDWGFGDPDDFGQEYGGASDLWTDDMATPSPRKKRSRLPLVLGVALAGVVLLAITGVLLFRVLGPDDQTAVSGPTEAAEAATSPIQASTPTSGLAPAVTPEPPIPEGQVSRATSVSDPSGTIQVVDGAGSPVAVTLEDRSGTRVEGAHAVSVADERGVLVLVVPPPDSGLVPTFEFIPSAQGMGGHLAAPLQQGPITMHISGVEETDLDETRVPPGLLEELWNSPGWHKTVETAHEWCEKLSFTAEFGHIAYVSFDVSKTIIWSTSLAKLKTILAGGVLGTVAIESLTQLCLAATGDPVGLTQLTGVVNDDWGYEMLVIEDVPVKSVALGRVLDGDTGAILPGVSVKTMDSGSATLDNGAFFLPVTPFEEIEVLLTKNCYESASVGAAASGSAYLYLGDIELAADGSCQAAEGLSDSSGGDAGVGQASDFQDTGDCPWLPGIIGIWKESLTGGGEVSFHLDGHGSTVGTVYSEFEFLYACQPDGTMMWTVGAEGIEMGDFFGADLFEMDIIFGVELVGDALGLTFVEVSDVRGPAALQELLDRAVNEFVAPFSGSELQFQRVE